MMPSPTPAALVRSSAGTWWPLQALIGVKVERLAGRACVEAIELIRRRDVRHAEFDKARFLPKAPESPVLWVSFFG